MSESLGLGKLIETEQQRDAIHIAVAPVTAGEKLQPGEHVGIGEDGNATGSAAHIGVVDPYLKRTVYTGQRFWLFLYPGSITSLRHEWMHPAFGGPQAPADYISRDDHMTKSKAWIAAHAETLGLSAGQLMEDAADWLLSEDYKIQRDSERWRDNFNATEFWHHYEVVTGKPVPENLKRSFYCCTC